MRFVVVVAALLGILALNPTAALASPTATVEQPTVRIGDRVYVRLDGWPVQRSVVLTICGNEAARGSIDCALSRSQGFPIRANDAEHRALFLISEPPMPCPCVILVTNEDQSEKALAPIVIEGFPTAPVIGNTFSDPLRVGVKVHRAKQGAVSWLRSFVGGRTIYVVEVTMVNRGSAAIDDVRLIARAGRSANDQARRVELPTPDVLKPGETWVHAQRVTLSAPVIGGFVWTVNASGDASIARATDGTSHQPYGLYLLLTVLVGDVAWLVWRRVKKTRG